MTAKFDIPPLPAGISNEWKGSLTDVSLGRDQMRFWWKPAGPRTRIDGWVESFSWDDMGDVAPVLSGSITLREGAEDAPIPKIQLGDQIIFELRASPAAAWKEQVRLRVNEPQRLGSGQSTYQLENDAALLSISKDNWRFPKDKSHPQGWRPWQIIDEVAQRCKIRVVMPKVGKPIKKFPAMLNSSAIDVINAALKHLRDTERKTLIRRFEAGTLYLSVRHYSPELMMLGPQLIEASLVSQRRVDYATSLTVRTAAEVAKGKDSKGKKKATHKGIVVNVTRPQFVKRYGYVHLVVYAHGADSIAEARALGLAHLARVLQHRRTLTLTTPYIPGLRRGAYIRVTMPRMGLSQIVYVQSVSHSAGAGSLTMDLTVGFDDPQITPPLDRVNSSSRALSSSKRKATNPKPAGAKADAATAQKPKPTATLGGVTTR